MAGRPSLFTKKLADTICARLAEGESLRGICRSDDMPASGTVLRWLTEDDKASFRDQYARARDAQADALVEECLEIADDGSNDWMTREGKDQLNGEHVNRSRLRVDTRKWWAARLAPKKYGDRQILAGDSENPLEVVTRIERKIIDGSNA